VRLLDLTFNKFFIVSFLQQFLFSLFPQIQAAYPTQQIQYKKVVPNVERRWHCSFLSGNRFFIQGGWNDSGPLNDMLMFDFDTMQWSQVPTKNNPSPRRWHTLTSMADNHRYVCYGGYDGPHHPLKDLLLFNAETQLWSQPATRGSPPPALCRHTLTPLSSDPKQMFLLGGYCTEGYINKDVYILHTDDMSWQKVQNTGCYFPIQRAGHRIACTPHGSFLSGGFGAEYVSPFFWARI